MMNLADFLSQQEAISTETAVWHWNGHDLPLRETAYRCSERPPLQRVTSVRTLLFRDDEIMVVRDVWDKYHIYPGGQREEGESVDETLRRELLEETGWTLRDPQLLGLIHFEHQAPQPDGFPYPYPDFVQLIFTAVADRHFPEAIDRSSIEVESGFRPIATARRLFDDKNQHAFLRLALQKQRNRYEPAD